MVHPSERARYTNTTILALMATSKRVIVRWDKSPVQQQMMNMVPVGTERRTTFKNAYRKYPKRIQQWYHKNGKPDGRRRLDRIHRFRTISRINKFK